MAGLCGLIGEQPCSVKEVSTGLYYHNDENSSIYEDSQVSIGYVDHPISFEKQPIKSKTGDSLIWVWGEVLGHEHRGVYRKKSNDLTDVEYCALLYKEHGRKFPHGLNSEFSGIIYNKERKKVSLFTDRLGSRPIYYTHTDDGALVFSSLLQSLQLHPDVSFEYNKDYLSEFFSYGRSLGIHTPIEDVKALPPASIIEFDLNGSRLNHQTYWSPKVQPLDLSFTEFINRFQEIFTEAVHDRSKSKRKEGLLLSGGSDSRAILAAHDRDLIAFHMNELPNNKEAQLSQEIAETAGVQFQFLQRNADYLLETLERCSNIMNFVSKFTDAKAIGFEEDISNMVDAIFCGQWSDAIISGTYVPKETGQQPMNIRSIGQYIKEFDSGSMGGYSGKHSFLKNLPDPADVLGSNINKTNNGIKWHGVQYPSWESLVEFGAIYPITNVRSFLKYESLVHAMPTHYPYLDNRLVDLILQTPAEFRYENNIIDKTVSQIDAELASIPHANTGMPLSDPGFIKEAKGNILNNKYVNHLLTTPKKEIPGDFLVFIGLIDKNPFPTTTHINSGSWINIPGVIRTHPFVENKLHEHEKILINSEFLNKETAWKCYNEHCEGKDNWYELIYLLTFLEIDSNIRSTR